MQITWVYFTLEFVEFAGLSVVTRQDICKRLRMSCLVTTERSANCTNSEPEIHPCNLRPPIGTLGTRDPKVGNPCFHVDRHGMSPLKKYCPAPLSQVMIPKVSYY
jgi:hypothetical protein